MVIQFSDYCYAKQLLHEQGLEVYQNGTKIITPIRHIYNTVPVTTKLVKGYDLLEKEIIKEINSYEDLKGMGYVVVSEKVKRRWFHGQRVQYVLKRRGSLGNLGSIPPNHKVIMSSLNKQIRLIGPNAGPRGYGSWVDLTFRQRKKRIVKDKRYSFKDIKKNRLKLRSKLLGRFYEEDLEYINIPELPVMFSNSGELVCIPQIDDEYVILIVGRRGTGKTYSTASISSRLYWNWNKRVIMLNDHHDQCHTWALPNLQSGARRQLQHVNNHAMPLPLIFLYPKTNTFFEEKMFGGINGDISFLMSLPLYEVIQDYKNYLKGNKEWELGKSAIPFRNMQEELLKCKDFDDLKEVVTNYQPDDADTKLKFSTASMAKIIMVMDDIFSQQILDINTDVASKWVLSDRRSMTKEELYPVIALLKANIIPVIKTKDVITKFYYSQYMKYIIDSIFNNQTLNPWFYNNRIAVYMVIDEITDIANKQKLWDVGGQSLMNCATQGRPNRIGMIANTQDYTRIPDTIVNQSEYCFTLQLKHKEAAKVGADFELRKEQIDEIKNLEKFEMMALTKRKFVIYDKLGNRRESGPEEAIRGYSLPPLCQHQPPKR